MAAGERVIADGCGMRDCEAAASDTPCCVCAGALCETCAGGCVYSLADWLDIANRCAVCGAIACADCITVCHACANKGDTSLPVCLTCARHYTRGCTIHRWPLCEDHAHKKCGECRANRNYAGKMGDL